MSLSPLSRVEMPMSVLGVKGHHTQEYTARGKGELVSVWRLVGVTLMTPVTGLTIGTANS